MSPNLRFFVCLLTLALSAPVLEFTRAAAAASTDKLELRALCAANNKQSDFLLTRVSQLRGLAEQLETDPSSGSNCSPSSLAALRELSQLVGDSRQNVCSPQQVNKMREFSDKYIDTSVEIMTKKNKTTSGDKAQEPLAKWLHNFYLAYGMRVSGTCKKHMIGSLMYDSHEILNEHDYAALDKWTNDESIIAGIMNEPSDYDDIMLPRDIARAMFANGTYGEANDKLLLQTVTGKLIERIQLVCERRFRPIYEQLILPVVGLSNLGFNYQGEELAIELREMSVNKEVHRWYRIVYICESLGEIEIVDDPEFSEHQQQFESDKRVVRVLTKQEAAELAARSKTTESENKTSDLQQLAEFPPVDYKHQLGQGAPLDQDQLLDTSDSSFMRLIKQFSSNKSELDRIRDKLFKKVGAFILQSLKRGQIKIIGNFFKRPSQDGTGNANDELVRALDGMINDKVAGSNGLDAPVAGMGSNAVGVAKRYYNHATYKGFSGISQSITKNIQGNVSIKRKFWYTIATVMFIIGIALLISG